MLAVRVELVTQRVFWGAAWTAVQAALFLTFCRRHDAGARIEQRMEPNKNDNVKRTIWMNDALFDKIKMTAKEQGKTASAFISEALSNLLNNPLSDAVKRYAKREGLTPDEFIRAAVVDRIAASNARRAAERELEKAVGNRQ